MGSGRESLDYRALTPADRLTALISLQHKRAKLDAAEQRLLALIDADPTDDDTLRDVTLSKRYVREEVAVALRVSPVTAGARMNLANDLVHNLPTTLAMVEAGELPLFFARALVAETDGLPADTVTEVETRVLAKVGDQSYGAFKRTLRRAVLTADPRGAEERHESAFDERRICDTPDSYGMSWLNAYLPDHAVQAILNRLDAAQRSKRNKQADDDRSMDQRRADALTHFGLTGTLAGFDTVADNDASGATDTPADCSCGGSTSGTASTTGGIEVRVVVALSTLAGLDDQPAEIDGHGPIPATLARKIAFSEHGTTWRRLVTDPLGHLIDYGTTVYKPPAPLDRHVRARDQHCRAPGCHRRAVTCDLDHVEPFSQGGPTSACNLHSLCARHHKMKHEAGWKPHVHDDGTTVWTTPAGLTATVEPATYPIDTTSTHREPNVHVDFEWRHAA